jgi:hypothetical protein
VYGGPGTTPQLQSLQIIPGPLAVEQSTLHGRGLEDVQARQALPSS